MYMTSSYTLTYWENPERETTSLSSGRGVASLRETEKETRTNNESKSKAAGKESCLGSIHRNKRQTESIFAYTVNKC